MANPWDNDPVIGSAQSAGGPVYGPPPKKDPYKDRDQVLQEQAAARAAEDQQFQREKLGWEREKFEREQVNGGADGKLTGDERLSAGYYRRALNAHRQYGGGVAPRDVVTQTVVDFIPQNWVNSASSPERRAAENYAEEFIRAKLRKESGASISPMEKQTEYPVYFPIPGDSQEDLERKARLRAEVIEGLRIAAGGAAAQGEAGLAPGQVSDNVSQGAGQFGDQAPELNAPKMNPERQAAYDALVASGATAEQIAAFGERIGMRIDNAQAVADARDAGAGFVGAKEGVYNEEGYRQQLDQQLEQQGYDPSVAQPFERGITAGLSDEIYGLGRAGSALMQGQNVPEAYIQNRDLMRRANEQAYESNPVGSFIAELGGGAAIPGGSAKSLKDLARVGAIQGGVSGFGYGDGAAGSIGGAAIGAPLGAAAGVGVGRAGRKLSDLMGRPNAAAQEVIDNRAVIEAGQRQNIPIRQPDARPTVRGDFAGVEASQTGNPIVARTLQADEAAVQGRVAEVGGKGQALDDYDLGQRVQSGGEKYLARTRGQANALYSRAEQAAGNAQGEATGAIQKLDEHIADLKATGERTNSGVIKYLEDLKADLSGGASIAKLRNIRKNMRGQINERNLTSTDAERRVGDALGALSQDVERILPDNARGAFKNADTFYRQRMEFKDQVVRRFIGPKNDPIAPETAAARFKSFMKSKDYGRFSRMMDELESADRADIAATVAEHLGKGRNGSFSLAALASNTDPKNFSPKALEKVFGKDGAAALEDLRVIAAAKRDTAGSLNSSRTGIVTQRMGLKDAMMGIMGGSVAGIPGAIGGMAIRNVSEKIGNRRLANALLSSDFSKWLKNAPNNPAAAKPYIAQLSKVAARNAGAAADIKAIQSALTEAFAQSPGRAAAEGKQENNGR